MNASVVQWAFAAFAILAADGSTTAVSSKSPPNKATVIQVLRDFEDGVLGAKQPAIVLWSWTPEQKANALDYATTEIVGDSPFGQQCLKLTVTDRLPPRQASYRMIGCGVDYLPPEVDAIRLRVKVLKGRFLIAAGGPTVYFGHSDVTSRTATLDAETHGEWSIVELSLTDELRRNFRRSQWGHHSPVIYYTRWIQEPLAIEVEPESRGEMLVDQVELVGHGRGRPYPTFDPAKLTAVAPSIDFEDPASMRETFTVMTNTTEQPDFDREPHLVRPSWAPPQIARVAERHRGRHSLEMVMTGTEEACFAGVKILGVPAANAIALTIMAEYAGAGKPGVVLDFLAYAAPPTRRGDFPWDGLRPPQPWRNNPETAFTFYLSPKNPAVQPASFGFYHTRRSLPNRQWTTLVLPLDDFICSYGQGEMATAFRQQTALTGENLFALTFLSYFGQRSKPLRLLIDEVRLVKAPGTPEELRSFSQSPPRAQ